MSEYTKCNVCQKPASQKCSNCMKLYYCGREHQKVDWKSHKTICLPFKIDQNVSLGRHLVATRSIKKGERILLEAPLVWGPAPSSIPVCLGCAQSLSINPDGYKSCTKCGWPICGELCEKSPQHYPECKYTILQRGTKIQMKNTEIPHPIYQCITVLRCLYQKQFLPKNWKRLECLESHCEKRKDTPQYKKDRVLVAEFIRRFFKLAQIFSEEEILRVCGIVAVNGHEVPLSEPPYVAIFSTAALFEHSCMANCAKSFTDRGDILIVAAQDIPQGEHLSICYTDPLWGTVGRRQHLWDTKFFWCKCTRCVDPMEFGTGFSGVKCQKRDCSGIVLPTTFLFEENEKIVDNLYCNGICNGRYSSAFIREQLERIGETVIAMDRTDPEACKAFLQKYSTYLGENHYILIEVKILLVHNLGQSNGINQLTTDDLHLKEALCKELVAIINVLAFAERRTLGSILFEWHATLAELSSRYCTENHKKSKEFLEKSRTILIQCISNLENEPQVLPEGKICRQAKENLKGIDRILRKIA